MGLTAPHPRKLKLGEEDVGPFAEWAVSIVPFSKALGFSKHLQFGKAWEVLAQRREPAVWKQTDAEDGFHK